MPKARPARIIVTRALYAKAPGTTDTCPLAGILTARGYRVLSLPMTAITPVHAVLPPLSTFDWVFFTSANGVRGLKPLLPENTPLPAIGTVGKATAAVVKDLLGVEARFISAKTGAAEAATEFTELLSDPHVHVLWPCGNLANAAFREILSEARVAVTPITVYETAMRPNLTESEKQALQDIHPDVIVFTSPSAIHNWQALMFNNPGMAIPPECAIACIGPTTAEAAQKAFGRCEMMPQRPTLEDLADSIDACLNTP